MMDSRTRYFRVGGLAFSVRLEEPWSFIEYTAPVAERIRKAAAGDELEILPTRAGDNVPPRTFIRSKAELPENFERHMLDFSQYEPFRCDAVETIFDLVVAAPGNCSSEGRKFLIRIDEMLPYYTIWSEGDTTIFEIEYSEGKKAGTLFVRKGDDGFKGARYVPEASVSSSTTMWYISTALMILYTYNAALHDTLLIHSSTIRHNGLANMFLGKSGTGKSTHSRIWLDNVSGTELLNDDNPVIGFLDGTLRVYGSPWSGKTPCYRNVSEKVRAIVNLHQDPSNSIAPMRGLDAYAALYSSMSSVSWERSVMDHITATMSRIAMAVPCYNMKCNLDPSAATVCMDGIEKTR